MPVSYNPKDLAAYLYMAYFGRAGEPEGFAYWQSQLTYDAVQAANNPSYHGPATFRDAAMGFANQLESQNKYALFAKIAAHTAPTDGDIATFLNTVYSALFNRGVDQGGAEYWSGIIKSRLTITDAVIKAQQIGAILADIIGGAQGSDIAVIANKAAAAEHFTDLMRQAHVADSSASVAILAAVGASSDSLALANAQSEQALIATYEIAPSVATVAEGHSVTFSLQTTHVIPGTFLDYTIAATGDAGTPQTGHVLIDATGKATVTVLIPTNNVTGDSGALTMTLDNGKGNAAHVAVTDATPTYAVTASGTINEGQTETFTLHTTNLAAGTAVAYTIVGTGGEQSLTTSGTAVVDSNGNATVSVPVPTNAVSGDSGTLTMSLVNGQAHASANVTDVTPVATYQVSALVNNNTANEGQTILFAVQTHNVAPGTQIAYLLQGTNDAAGLSGLGNLTVDANGYAVVSVTVPANATVGDSGTLMFGISAPNVSPVTVNIHDMTSYSLASATGTINEGGVATFNLTTTGIPAGTSVAYQIAGTADAAGLATSGTFIVDANGHATVSIPVPTNSVTGDGGHLTMSLLNGAVSPVTINVTDTTPVPTYAIAASSASLNEGQTETFTLTTTGVAPGTLVEYRIVGDGGVAGLSTSGTATIDASGHATVSIPVANNYVQGDGGHLTMSLLNGLATPVQVTVNDVTPTPTYSIIASSTPVAEGQTETFTLNTTGLAVGTQLGYTIVGTGGKQGLSTSGTATIDANGHATVSVVVPTNAVVGDGGTLTMSLVNGHAQASANVTDTTPVPTYAIAASSASLDEGHVETFTLTTTGVAPGTLVEYRIVGDGGVAGLSTSGTATIDASGHATVSIPVANNYVQGDGGHLTMSLLNGLATPVQVTVNDVTPTPTYSIIASSTPVAEGQTETFTLNTTGLAVGTQLGYTIVGTGGKQGLSTSGTATIDANGHATVSVVVPTNAVVGDGGTLTMSLVNGQAQASANVTDTTPVPTYVITAATDSINEGQTETFTLTTTGVAPGTQVAYHIAGTGDAAGLTQSGTVIIDAAGHATVTVTVPQNAIVNDNGTLTMALLNGAATPVTVNVNDMTSYALAAVSGTVNEGGVATFNLTTTGIPAGTSIAYQITGTADAAGLATSGTFIVDANGHATVSISTQSNNIIGDSGVLTMSLLNGNVTPVTVNVQDITPVPTYDIVASAASVAEGQVETFTLVTTHVPAGTSFAYTITGDGDAAGVQLQGTVVVDATGRAQVAVTLPTNFSGADSGHLTMTIPGIVDGSDNPKSLTVDVVDATPQTLDLTVGNDVFDHIHLVRGTLRTQIFTGASPTLNLSDSVTNVDILALTDNYGDGTDIMPSGVTLDNIAHITLNTAGNAGQLTSLIYSDHIYFDTTHINPTYTGAEGNSGVPLQSVDIVSQGDHADYVRAAYWTDVSVTHQHIANSGNPNNNLYYDGVNVIGGHNVNVVSSGNGDVVVGSHSAGSTPDVHYTSWGPSYYGEVPTGDVSVTQHGDANTYVFGGVNIDVHAYNHGNINIGVGENNDAWYEPYGNVYAYAYDGNVKIWGGAHPEWNSDTQQYDDTSVYVEAVGTIEVGTSDGHHSPEGDVTVYNQDWADGPISVYGGHNIRVDSHTFGDITVGSHDARPTGDVLVNHLGISTTYVLGGQNVTVNSGYGWGGFDPQTGFALGTNGGDVWVGITGAEGTVTTPNGDVVVTQFSGGNTTILGGQNVDVVSNQNGNVNIGMTGGEGGVVSKPAGDVSVNARYGNIAIVGGNNITIGAPIGDRADRFVQPWNGAGAGSVTLGLDQVDGGPTGNIDVTIASGAGAITIYGGHNITLDTAGSGGIYVENGGHGTADVGAIDIHDHATGGNIVLTGGTTVAVDIDNAAYAGNVTIGTTNANLDCDGDNGAHGDAAANPSDNITFTSVATRGAANLDTILGGIDVTVEVNGDTVHVGAPGTDNAATGMITITQHGNGNVVALGGEDVTVTSEGTGDVTIGTTEDRLDFVLPTGDVHVDARHGNVVIMGGINVAVGDMISGPTDLSGDLFSFEVNWGYNLLPSSIHNGDGNITIGDALDAPSGDVHVQQAFTDGFVHIIGGDNVTVVSGAEGGITIGDAADAVVASGDIVVSHVGYIGDVNVVGGQNVRVFSLEYGDVTIGVQGGDYALPTGDVVVNSWFGDITIMGGDKITVGDQVFPLEQLVGGHGSVTIGDDNPDHAPKGTVTVNQPGSLGYVHINGGTDITVNAIANQGVHIGYVNDDSSKNVLNDGTITVTQGANGAVDVLGGIDVKVTATAGASVTIGRDGDNFATPSGNVDVQANAGAVEIYGGVNINVGVPNNYAGTGSVTIGDNDATHAPSGTVVVNQAPTSGFVHINGGTDVTVHAHNAGGIVIGSAEFDVLPSDAVTVNQAGDGAVIVVGGSSVTVDDTGSGVVQVGLRDGYYALTTGDVNVDAAAGDVIIVGGANVNVGQNHAGTGSVHIGEDDAAHGPAGDVVVTQAAGSGAVAIYGGSAVTVTTAGTGGVTIEDGGHGPAAVGAVSVTDTGSGPISITGGTTVDVTVTNLAFAGNITIGSAADDDADGASDAAQNPTGDVNLTSNATSENTDTIYGGANITVNVAVGTVLIGQDDNDVGPSGDVNVTVAGGEGYIGIFGGHNVTVTTGASGGVTIEDGGHGILAVDVAAVMVTDTGTGGNIDITGGTTVDVTVNNAAFVGNINIGNDGDVTSGDAAALPSGNVTVTSNATNTNTDTIYGGDNITVNVAADNVIIGEDDNDIGPIGNVTVNVAGGEGFVNVFGGHDVTVTTAGTGGVTIEDGGHGWGTDPVTVGTVSVAATGGGDIDITGGTDVTVNIGSAGYVGNITIGNDADGAPTDYDAAALPSGDITVTSTSTKGNTDTIYGGVNVTVTVVNDTVIIGNDDDSVGPTGNVDVTVAGGEGYLNIYGGADITVKTGSTGGVAIEDGGHGPSAVAVGAVDVTATGSAGDIAITGGTTVDVTVNNAAFNGDITIGRTLDDNDGDVETINPSGNVTVKSNSDVGKGNTDTIYGGKDIKVDVSGDTVVVGLSTAGTAAFVPSGTVDIHNLQDTTFTGLAGADTMGGSIEVYGGTDVTVHSNTGGTITIGNDNQTYHSPSGDIKVYDTASAQNGAYMMRDPGAVADVGNVITIHGGVASNVTVEAGGASVLIGNVTDTDIYTRNPGGSIDVTETTNSHGVVRIEGGDGITVNAQGQQVHIGTFYQADGDVLVNQASVYTGNALGSGNDLSSVSVDGGDTVTINTTGGDVNVNQNYGTTSGTIDIHNSFSGAGTANSAEIIVAGGSTVNITVDNTTSGTIVVGVAPYHLLGLDLQSLSGTFGNFATGDVTIMNAVTHDGVTTYGTSQFGVLTSGEVVSVTGGGNGGVVDFTNVASLDGVNLIVDATLVNTLLQGAPITTPSVKTVTLDGVQGTTVIVSHDLATLTISNSVANRAASTVAILNSGTILGQSYTAFPSQLAATLELIVNGASNHDTQVIDQVHGTIDLTTNAAHNYVAIDAYNASHLIIENGGDLTITNSGTYGTSLHTDATIAIINQGGLVDLGNVGNYGHDVSEIDGSQAAGAIYAEIDGQVTTFMGGSGDDIVVVDADPAHIAAGLNPDEPLIDGGLGHNMVVLTNTAYHYDPLATSAAHYAIANDFSNFQVLGFGYGTDGVYDVANFEKVVVMGSDGSLVLTKANIGETLQFANVNGGYNYDVEWHFTGSTAATTSLDIVLGSVDVADVSGSGQVWLNKSLTVGSGPQANLTGEKVTAVTVDSISHANDWNSLYIYDGNSTVNGTGNINELTVTGDHNVSIGSSWTAIGTVDVTNTGYTELRQLSLSQSGVTIIGGTTVASGATSHVIDGVTVHIDGSNVGHIVAQGATYGTGVIDQVISGAGGVNYTAGAGGAGNDPSGFEHVDLKASQNVVDRIQQ